MFCSANLIAQTNEQIVLTKKGYTRNEQLLKRKEIKQILKNDPASESEYRKFQSLQTLGLTLQTVVQLGISAVTFPSAGGILAGMLGGFLVGIPFTIPAGNHYEKAIKKYNQAHGGLATEDTDVTSNKKTATITQKSDQENTEIPSEIAKQIQAPTPPKTYAKQASQPGQTTSSFSESKSMAQISEKEDATLVNQKSGGFIETLKFGIKAGLNMSMMSSESASDFDRLKPGFRIGGTVEYPLSDKLSLGSGLFFNNKGESYKYESSSSTYNLNFLELPIHAIYKLNVEGKDVFINGGPYIGMNLGGKRISKYDGDVTKKKLDPEMFDYGLNVGFSTDIDNFRIGLQYDFGLANSFTNESKHRVISFSIGYGLEF